MGGGEPGSSGRGRYYLHDAMGTCISERMRKIRRRTRG